MTKLQFLLPLTAFALVCTAISAAAEPSPVKPLTPAEARTKVGQEITVEMLVRSGKNRLEKRGEIYLDAKPAFRDAKNFAVVITRAGAALFRDAGVGDPAEHFLQKTVRARGTVKVVDDVPRIEVNDPKQLEIVEKP